MVLFSLRSVRFFKPLMSKKKNYCNHRSFILDFSPFVKEERQKGIPVNLHREPFQLRLPVWLNLKWRANSSFSIRTLFEQRTRFTRPPPPPLGERSSRCWHVWKGDNVVSVWRFPPLSLFSSVTVSGVKKCIIKSVQKDLALHIHPPNPASKSSFQCLASNV